jgi:hypothetical protein
MGCCISLLYGTIGANINSCPGHGVIARALEQQLP